MNERELVLKLSEHSEVCRETTRQVLTSDDVQVVYSKPPQVPVRNLLPTMQVRMKTTARAGTEVIGLAELIHVLETLPGDEQILCFGFSSEAKEMIGVCYTNSNATRLIGCVWLKKRLDAPPLDPRLITPHETTDET